MLYTNGNDVVRIQCAFIDTPVKIRILLVHKSIRHRIFTSGVHGEDSGINLDVDISERDTLFREAAEVIVNAQQGSASLLQRKLKLGYNRAGRLIDQLEAAGIVGPFEEVKHVVYTS
jgi:S-DNA-T family DNA segregation ATPase FtsK/SpoIIIE